MKESINALMRLLEIRHGVAQHVMESRVSAYKKKTRDKTLGGTQTGGNIFAIRQNRKPVFFHFWFRLLSEP